MRDTRVYRLVHGAADGLDDVTVDRFDRELIVVADDASSRDTIRRRVQSLLNLDETTEQEGGECDGLFIRRRSIERGVVALRETMTRVRTWARDATVLACGVAASGPALAALSVARDLFVVERAREAIEGLREEAIANRLAERPLGAVAGELHEQLERLVRRERSFEVVIVDVRAVLARAPRNAGWSLERVAALALRLGTRDVILVSDDARMARREMRRAVTPALAGCGGEIVALYGASAIDFPTLPDEESTLKVMLISLHRGVVA